MKDTEIHNKLPNKEIRDFLSASIITSYDKKRTNKKEFPSANGLDGIEWAIERTKIDIFNLQLEKEHLETLLSVSKIAKLNGWNEFDVSDFVQKTNNHCRSFFGTEDEYEKFMKENKFEY